jgi:hypothetical protein
MCIFVIASPLVLTPGLYFHNMMLLVATMMGQMIRKFPG